MSNGFVYKYGVGYSFQDEDKRVIDSNALVADKIEQLSAQMQRASYEEPSFGEDFAAGLDTVAVNRLLEDDEEAPDGFTEGLFGSEETLETTGSGNVIKAPRMAPQISMEEIEAEKESLLSEAKAEAEEIIAAATAEASGIKEEAYEEGRNAGFSEGVAMAENDYQQKLRELDEKSRELDALYDQKIAELEPLFVDTLTDIYEHIIHVKFADDKNIIFYLIRDAIKKVEGKEDFIIHVSKEDYGFVSMQKKELLSGVFGAQSAQIVEDSTLRANECFVETDGGIFDCSLETQLSGLKKELKLLSYSKD